MPIRVFPRPEDGLGRVETEAVRFGDDWPGLFVRGDVALYLAACIKTVLAAVPEGSSDARLSGHALERIAGIIDRDVLVPPLGKLPSEERAPTPSPSKPRRHGSKESSKNALARPRKPI
jgi:hypothetical protein